MVIKRNTFFNNPSGFTLIELMVTLSVAVILITVGIPSYQDIVRNNRVTAISNEMLTALYFARSEAIKRGISVSVCRSNDDQTACAADWADGFIVFADNDGSGTFTDDGDANLCEVDGDNDLTEDCLLRAWDAPKGSPTITGPNFVRYTGSGNATSAANFTISLPDSGVGQSRSLNVSLVGRADVTSY